MDKPISGEFRRQFEDMFAACAAANPHTTPEDQEQGRKALDLVEHIVRGTIARGVPTYIEADELIQECLTRLPDAIRGFSGKNGARLKTYLKTTIRNDVMDAIELARRDPATGAESLERDEDELSPDGGEAGGIVDGYGRRISHKDAALNISWDRSKYLREDRWKESGAITGVIERILTREQFEAVVLCDVHGMTQERAAEILNATRSAIASRLRKAHAALRKKVFGNRYQFPDWSRLGG